MSEVHRAPRRYRRDEKKYQKLRNLNCFNDAYDMIFNGFKLTEIASFIQEDKGEYLEVQPTTLVAILSDFKRSVMTEDEIAVQVHPERAKQALEKLNDHVDVLNEYQRLYDMQMARIQKTVAMEEHMNGMMLPQLGKEISRAADLLRQIKETQQEYGLTPRNIGQLTHRAEIGVVAGDKIPPHLLGSEKIQQTIEFFKLLENTDSGVLVAAQLFPVSVESDIPEYDDAVIIDNHDAGSEEE